MSSTGTVLQTLAGTLTEGETISDANALLWINEFLLYELGLDSRIDSSQNLPNSIANTDYALPIDFGVEFKVDEYSNPSLVSTSIIREYKGYSIMGFNINFKRDGNYKLIYFKYPTVIAALGSEVDIDVCFYKPLINWLAYRYLTNDDEENAKNQTLGQLRLQEYTIAMRKAISDRKKKYKKVHYIGRG